MKQKTIQLFSLLILVCLFACSQEQRQTKVAKRPNILFAISDDQSYPYASAYGTSGVNTPAFDRVAKSGILFHNAFVAAPQCSPSRAAILTGKNIWQLEEAGTHSSYFPKKFTVFTDLLKDNGYKTGYTGKAWGPGNFKDAGWENNPVGKAYDEFKYKEKVNDGYSSTNYFANFEAFFNERNPDEPFFFWYGGYEPHRRYQYNSGVEAGKKLEDVMRPGFLPEDSVILTDIADYTFEIEWFDNHLGKMLDLLEAKGELENTIVIVTSDNGMPFPYAKANLEELGTHIPLAIAWPNKWKGDRQTDALASLTDIAPTLLGATGLTIPDDMSGKSMLPLLEEDKTYREFVYTGRERHTHARPDNLGYPARAIRSGEYLYIRNFKPERWPAGDPAPEGVDITEDSHFMPFGIGFNDIDDSPSKSYVYEHQQEFPEAYQFAFEKRPEEELYHITNDPYCLKNLASEVDLDAIKEKLSSQLDKVLLEEQDPRMLGNGDIFECYPRFASMRKYSGFNKSGTYNKAYLPKDESADTISSSLSN